jgi:hypothetical protein
MTDQMRDDQLDNDIRSFLAWRAEDINGAPTATEVAMGINARSGTRHTVPGISAQLAWVLIAALLAVGLIGAAVVGANLLRDDRALVVVDPTPSVAPTAGPSYEAVFLRLETVGDSRQVIVVAVNADGHEREIARPPGAWYVGNRDLGGMAPMGAVSSSGLLAIPSGGDNPWLRWKIFDLRNPQAEPTVVSDIPETNMDLLRATPSWHRVYGRGSVFWGPGDRLGIAWYDCPRCTNPVDLQFSFVDGRTGAATTVDLPQDLEIFPLWTADGSGVFAETASNRLSSGSGDGGRDSAQVLQPDGSFIYRPDAGAVPSCITKYRSGAEITLSGGRFLPSNREPGAESYACLAPDESMVVHSLAAFEENPYTAGWGANTRIVLGGGNSVDVQGSFAGFLEARP